jgi:glycosyltransferase involved in cell wall biosynthesis
VNVWILQTGEPLQIDNAGMRPMRAINLSNELISQGHKVTIWASDFDHFSKTARFHDNKEIRVSDLLTIRLVKSRGYKSHVGFGRLLDHAQLAWNLSRQIKTKNLPDVAFIGYPPIEPAWVLSRWLHKNQIPFIVDVKDAWPKLLVDAFPNSLKAFARIALQPYFLMMKDSFLKASAISSISENFLEWSLNQINLKKRMVDIVVPLTSNEKIFHKTELDEASAWWDEQKVVQTRNLRLYFIGSLTDSFDFQPFVDIARKFPIEIVIAGDGPKRVELIALTQDLPNVKLPGWISNAQAKALIDRSDVAIAPTIDREDFRMSIPNKFFDALQHGKPMLASIEGPAAKLLLENHAGFTFKNNSASLEILISKFLNDPNLVNEMGENARKTYEKSFTSKKVYRELLVHLELIVTKSN